MIIIMMKLLTHLVKEYDPEAAQENNSVQYISDIIVEIKNKDGTKEKLA
jgi:hypothetical protein